MQWWAWQRTYLRSTLVAEWAAAELPLCSRSCRVFKGLLQPEPAAAPQAAAEGSPAAPEHAGLVADGTAAGAASNSSGSTQAPLPVALKVMDVADIGAFIQEAALLTRLAGGPHVVGLHGACVDGQQLIVVMELMEVRWGGLNTQFGFYFPAGSPWRLQPASCQALQHSGSAWQTREQCITAY